MSAPKVTSPLIAAPVPLAQLSPQDDDRREVHEANQLVHCPLAWRVARTRTDERAPGVDGRKHHRLGSPRPFEAVEQILQWHAVEPDVVRADPEVHHTAVAVRSRNAREVSKTERSTGHKVRRTEATRGIQRFEGQAARRQDPACVRLAVAGTADDPSHLLEQLLRTLDLWKPDGLVVSRNHRLVRPGTDVRCRSRRTEL